MRTTITTLFLALLLSGCSLYHIDGRDTTNKYYPAKSSAKEVAYIENLNRPHEVVGYVIVNTERRQSGGDVIEKLKIEAAKLGGDAITGIETNATGFWRMLPAQKIIGNGYIRANFRATVVVFQ